MGLRIGTSVMGPARTASRSLGHLNILLDQVYLKLSTGRNTSQASFNPSGAAISSRLKAQIRSVDAASNNALDGVSLAQTADSSLAEIEDSLQRMRELAVDADTGSHTTAELEALQTEFDDLATTISTLANGSEYNGTSLLNGAGTVSIGTDPNGSTTYGISLTDVTAGSGGLSVSGLDITTAASAAITDIDTALTSLSSARTSFGTNITSLTSISNALNGQSAALSNANSRIEDVDVAYETALLNKYSVIQQSATAVLAHSNLQAQSLLRLLGTT